MMDTVAVKLSEAPVSVASVRSLCVEGRERDWDCAM